MQAPAHQYVGGGRDRRHQIVAEAELLAQVDRGGRGRDHHLGSHVERAARERDRAHVPTEAVRALEQRDLGAGGGGAGRRDQPGDPAAHDHDDGRAAHRSATASRSWASTTFASVATNAGAAFGDAVLANGKPSARAAATASTSRS